MTLRKTLLSFSAITVAAATFLLPQVAHADSISFQLTDAVQMAAPGSTVSFYGTVYSTGNTGTIYFNGADDGVDAPLVLDDSAYFNSFAYSLDPNSSTSGLLFTIAVPTGVSGAYDGHFAIFGGSDDQTYNNLASAAFEVDVNSTSPVPEPGAAWLLATGLLTVPFLVTRRSLMA